MWFMGVGGSKRRISAPVIAAGPSGLRIRTRLHVTGSEAAALTAVGDLLGSLYRAELMGRVRRGSLDRRAQATWRADRKRALTVVSSSRWAGAITRAVEDQYQLGMLCLSARVADLRQALDVLERRCALRPGERARAGGGRRGARIVGSADIAAPLNDLRRRDVLRFCALGWLLPSRHWRRADLRSQWAGSACGATVRTSMTRQ